MKPLSDFYWITLKKVPTWKDVENVMMKLREDGLYDADKNAGKLHDQFTYVKIYCTDDKIKQWKTDQVTTTGRWTEMFNHFENNDCEYTEIAKIVEYVLCLPGTTASVERVFSSVGRNWTKERNRLNIETLKTILTVKVNLKLSCIEFYEYIKTKPDLLREIASKKKNTQFKPQPVKQLRWTTIQMIISFFFVENVLVYKKNLSI